jgi:hypothetical protein
MTKKVPKWRNGRPDPECSAAWRRAGRADVVHLAHGDAGVFAVNQRPVAGKRGMRRVALRHGVSRLTSGTLHTGVRSTNTSLMNFR